MEHKRNRAYSIGVIIPTWNEEHYIASLLEKLQAFPFTEIIVVDGGSTDTTQEKVLKQRAILIRSKEKGRAKQMNLGALSCKAEYVLFLHADVLPPSNLYDVLQRELQHNSIDLANFRLQFDTTHWFLRLNAWFSRFTALAFQFGDQGLLINKELFLETGGFNEQLLFMEGNEIIRRLKHQNQYRKLASSLTVSARKYEEYGVFKLQFCYYLIYVLVSLGISQEKVQRLFKHIL